ncbi:hypothetical protein BY996DRAFT_1170405 [Phakopsora pachyrhizi]|nr:hypothetical protein BY996DRAFT_1242734 [Phakopsora pachyrhizi]KAI8446949.1 hypothetical protein BY996DRAFT_1170405 [Phakopsora pachyrhizi]
MNRLNQITTTTLPLSSSTTQPISLNSNTNNNMNGASQSLINKSSSNQNSQSNPSGTEINPTEISTPQELIGWVDEVINKLESKFDRVEQEVLERLDLLGKRIDSLEGSMSDLLENAATSNPVLSPTENSTKPNGSG